MGGLLAHFSRWVTLVLLGRLRLGKLMCANDSSNLVFKMLPWPVSSLNREDKSSITSPTKLSSFYLRERVSITSLSFLRYLFETRSKFSREMHAQTYMFLSAINASSVTRKYSSLASAECKSAGQTHTRHKRKKRPTKTLVHLVESLKLADSS